jgi:hypothetical protein
MYFSTQLVKRLARRSLIVLYFSLFILPFGVGSPRHFSSSVVLRPQESPSPSFVPVLSN